MRYLLLLTMLMLTSLAFSLNTELCTTLNDRVVVSLSQIRTTPVLVESEDNPTLCAQTYALPFEQASLQINSMHWKVYDLDGNYQGDSDEIERTSLYLSNSFTFREMRGFTVNLRNQIIENNNIKVLDSAEYEVIGSGQIELPTSISPAFELSYKKLAANYQSSYLRNLPVDRPKMLIISHSTLSTYITDFVKWKRQKGFEVYVVNKSDAGNSSIAIRDFVLAHYNQYHCDYLLLLGDESGGFAIPTNSFTSPDGAEQDADDNFYSMLSGTDYFPELLVGRFSFGDVSELLTQLNKTISYEKAPFMSNTTWMTKALVVAGNYAEGGLQPVTPVQMSRWLREKLLAKGYAAVDTVFYPPSYPGTSAIQASINQGVQFVSYRGWGDANGWHYPYFHIPELQVTMNGPRMPIVFSIVCNTGDFVNSINPCFGEKWMRMGTVSSPGGCVAFIGPSDLHTRTNLNNTISTGTYSAIFDDGERSFGAANLAGKMELYHNYPNDLGADGYVAFYFHVYNMLSDPSLNMWVMVPSTIPASVITSGTTLAQSDSHVTIEAANLNGAWVTGTKNGTDFTYAKVHDGVAILPVDPEQTGNLTVTISKPNFVPLVATITASEPASIGLTDNSLEGDKVFAGQSYTMTLAVKNYSTAAMSGISANLTATPSEYVTIQNASQTIGSLAAGASTNLTYNFTVAGNVPAHEIIRFVLNFPNQTTQASFEQLTGGPEFVIQSATGTPVIGGTTTLSFTAINGGSFAWQTGSVTVVSSSTAAVVTSTPVTISSVAIGATTTFQIQLQVLATCFEGRNLPLQFNFTTPGGYLTRCYYAVVAGNPSANDPTGPDGYGYYAYDSNDTSYPQHPTYTWVEIDPALDGQGTVFEVMDDGSTTVNLPFTFRYYGQDYNRLTICSNGWASLVPTWMSDFNNLYIPAALGPYAMLAPYWDDLKGMKTGVDGQGNGIFANMRVCYWHDAANNRYIVEWNDAYNNFTIDLMEDASLEKFQIILYPRTTQDGDIVYQYHTVDNPATTNNYCTVGIENHLQNDGLTYTFSNFYPVTASPLTGNLAVKFTTDAPDSFESNEDNVAADLLISNLQNSPNPFNPETTISFQLSKQAEVSVEIYNTKGQLVRTLLSGNLSKGKQTVAWNGKDNSGLSVGSGIYLYKVKSGTYTSTRKMMLMK